MKKVLKWIGGIFVALVLMVMIFGGTSEDTSVDVTSSTATTDQESEPATTKVEEAEPVEEPEEPKEPSMTMAQQNAVGSAESYISTMAFSKSGLVEQLEFEGYSKENAEFAVNNIQVDWNEQAVLAAKSYLDTMSFSRSGLIDQLVFEGFTQEQAEHAASQVGY